MTYLLLGEDGEFKDSKIADLKKTILTSDDTLQFDYEILHADKLDSDVLKKALTALPALNKKRLILLRNCHKLSVHNKDLVIDFVSQLQDYAVLVLESDVMGGKDAFVKKISSHVEIFESKSPLKKNVFDMTKAMERRRPADALQILSELMDEGQHPLQIMGGLVWYWGRKRQRISYEQFEQGLQVLQETDLNIKRSRLKPDYAMEVLVSKLCRLMG